MQLRTTIATAIVLTACTPAPIQLPAGNMTNGANGSSSSLPKEGEASKPIPLQVMGVANSKVIENNLYIEDPISVPLNLAVFNVSDSTNSVPTGASKVAYWRSSAPVWPAVLSFLPVSSSVSNHVTFVSSGIAAHDFSLTPNGSQAQLGAVQAVPDVQASFLYHQYAQSFTATISVPLSSVKAALAVKPPSGMMIARGGQYDWVGQQAVFRNYSASDSINLGSWQSFSTSATVSTRVGVSDNEGRPVTGLKVANFQLGYPTFTHPEVVSVAEESTGSYHIIATWKSIGLADLPNQVSVVVVNEPASASLNLPIGTN